MYYAPTAEVIIQGEAVSDWADTDGNLDAVVACLYTGASWKYSTMKPACP